MTTHSENWFGTPCTLPRLESSSGDHYEEEIAKDGSTITLIKA